MWWCSLCLVWSFLLLNCSLWLAVGWSWSWCWWPEEGRWREKKKQGRRTAGQGAVASHSSASTRRKTCSLSSHPQAAGPELAQDARRVGLGLSAVKPLLPFLLPQSFWSRTGPWTTRTAPAAVKTVLLALSPSLSKENKKQREEGRERDTTPLSNVLLLLSITLLS